MSLFLHKDIFQWFLVFHDAVYQFALEIALYNTFSHRKTKAAAKLTDKTIKFYVKTARKI